MSALGVWVIGTLLLAAEIPQEPGPRFLTWDAQYYVVVRGTVNEVDPNSDGTFTATVVEAPESGVGVSEDPAQRNTQVKLGVAFEKKFGFFWGGTSRVGDPAGPVPKFLLKLVGNGHCLVREVPQGSGGVSFVELGALDLMESCMPRAKSG